jgi:hypothetical protein
VCHDGMAGSSAAWLAHLVWDQEVAGSNPAFPTSAPRRGDHVFFLDTSRLSRAKVMPTAKMTAPKTKTWGCVPTRDAP